MLSNVGLRDAIRDGHLVIENLQEEAIQPASIDLHLGREFIMPTWGLEEPLTVDPFNKESVGVAFCSTAEFKSYGYSFGAGEFLLAATSEVVSLNNELVAEVSGKSSLARLGLMVHVTAGFIDPGFTGPITLELFNCSPNSILLTPGMPVAQLAVSRLDAPANPAYSGKYQGATGPQVSMYWKNARPAEARNS